MPAEPDFQDPSHLPKRWLDFLHGVDEGLERPVELHCLGGFVVTVVYGIARDTGDLDALAVLPSDELKPLLEVAGLGSELCREFQLYVEQVGIADYPDSYEDRLVDLWPDLFARLRLRALEIHDVAVAKIARNNERDKFDVRGLAEAGHLDPKVLSERYREDCGLTWRPPSPSGTT